MIPAAIVAAIPGILGKLLPRILKDKDKELDIDAAVKQGTLEFDKMVQSGELDLLQGQQEVNKEEAKHKSIFVAGWRPAVGWLGAIALAYQFVVYPSLVWVWQTLVAFDVIPATVPYPPPLDATLLFSIVTSMLGIAGMRSYDKLKGTQTDKI